MLSGKLDKILTGTHTPDEKMYLDRGSLLLQEFLGRFQFLFGILGGLRRGLSVSHEGCNHVNLGLKGEGMLLG